MTIKILGIETSCDETAAAIVTEDKQILSNIVFSQIETHQKYGGVVPEVAARAHLDKIDFVIDKALSEAGCKLSDVSAVAATCGPGLIGGVIVGAMAAKSIAAHQDIPFIAVNHLEGHALTPRLTHKCPFPYLLLLVSGGHTQLLIAKNVGDYELLGSTMDDAIGEAFDKTAKMLGLPYPGGPQVEKMAEHGDPKVYNLPRPLKGRAGCDFSFSGLKTAVRKYINADMSEQNKQDLCASFQHVVADVVKDRCLNAIDVLSEHHPAAKHFVVAGGVAANQKIRSTLQEISDRSKLVFVAPPVPLCTDNAAMIAWAGVEKYNGKKFDDLNFAPRPRWPLNEL